MMGKWSDDVQRSKGCQTRQPQGSRACPEDPLSGHTARQPISSVGLSSPCVGEENGCDGLTARVTCLGDLRYANQITETTSSQDLTREDSALDALICMILEQSIAPEETLRPCLV